CPAPVQASILHEAMRTPPCPYHRRIVVNASGSLRVQPDADTRSLAWFALPPAMEFYYMQHHPSYRPLPPLEASLAGNTVGEKPMQMIYPEHGATLFIPTELSGESGRLVLRAAHRMPKATVHWDIDGQYNGSTSHDHQLAIVLADGEHRLTLTDDDGARIEAAFRTVSTRK
ncbi:MAG TPA: hypothetical protein PKY96_13480, partial [Flavobacteriales bacterium]|nr:hypothetical protein [Flavobacteriales bacterium]